MQLQWQFTYMLLTITRVQDGCRMDTSSSSLVSTPASHFTCFHDDHRLPKMVWAQGHSRWLTVAACRHQWGQQRQVIGELVRDEVLRWTDQHTYICTCTHAHAHAHTHTHTPYLLHVCLVPLQECPHWHCVFKQHPVVEAAHADSHPAMH